MRATPQRPPRVRGRRLLALIGVTALAGSLLPSVALADACLAAGDNVQTAIDALPEEGGVVCLQAGTFEGPIKIDKDNVTLEGPNADVSGTGTRQPEAVINAGGLTSGIVIGEYDSTPADGGPTNVTIQGLTVENYTENGIAQRRGTGTVVIRNNRILADDNTTTRHGIGISGGDNSAVSGNYVEATSFNEHHAAWAGAAIVLRGTSNAKVSGNHTQGGDYGINVTGHNRDTYPEEWWEASENAITNNVVEDASWGVMVDGNARGTTVEGNRIVGSTGSGLSVNTQFGHSPDAVTVSGNTLVDNTRHVTDYVEGGVFDMAALASENTFEGAATLSSTAPGTMQPGVEVGYDVTLEHDGDADLGPVVVFIDVERVGGGLTAEDVSMQYLETTPSEYRPLPLTLEHGRLRTRFGPSAGFEVSSEYTGTTPMRVTIARPGTYVTTARVVNPDDNRLFAATQTQTVVATASTPVGPPVTPDTPPAPPVITPPSPTTQPRPVTTPPGQSVAQQPGQSGAFVGGQPVSTTTNQVPSVPPASQRTPQQVQQVQSAANQVVGSVTNNLPASVTPPVTVENTDTGANVNGLLASPEGSPVPVPAENVVSVTAGNAGMVVAGADGNGSPTGLTDDGAPTLTPGGYAGAAAVGFTANSSGQVQLASDPIVLAEFTTDADGVFKGQVAIPDWVPAGNHTLIVTGDGPDGDVTLLLGVTVEGDAPFADVSWTSTHAVAIARLKSLDITSGYADGTYDPAGDIIRGQMATFLARALELDTDVETDLVDAVGTHGDAIAAVVAAGVANGYPDGTFRGGQTVTRGQMAAFLANAAGLDPVAEGELSDVVGAHAGAINAVVEAGLASGHTDGTFRPDAPVNRAQMATFVVNLVDHLDS